MNRLLLLRAPLIQALSLLAATLMFSACEPQFPKVITMPQWIFLNSFLKYNYFRNQS